MDDATKNAQRVRRSAAVFLVALAGILFLAPSAPAAPSFGFNNSFSGPPEGTEARLFELEADAGAEIARIALSWAIVRPDPTKPANWALYDRRIGAITAAGMKPLIVVTGSPRWARPGLPCFSASMFCPPDSAHLDDWENFNYEVAKRYPEAVAIEVWNEPNLHGAWAVSGGPRPEHYALLFRFAAGAIHFANPSIPVVVASMTYRLEDRPSGNLTIPTYAQRFAWAGGFEALRPGDGLGVHASPWLNELESLHTQFATTMQEIRNARDRFAPGHDIWVTETGTTTTGPFAVSERQQARTAIVILENLSRQPDVAAALIHTSVEPTPNPGHPAEEGAGVLKWADFRAKLAYCVLLEMAGRDSAPYPGCPGDLEGAIGRDIPGAPGGPGGEEPGGGGGPGAGDPSGPDGTCGTKIARLERRVSRLRARRSVYKPYARKGHVPSRRAVRRITKRIRAKEHRIDRLIARCG